MTGSSSSVYLVEKKVRGSSSGCRSTRSECQDHVIARRQPCGVLTRQEMMSLACRTPFVGALEIK